MWKYNYGYPNELYHHGVLGMKWGHRKAVSVSAIANRGLAANARGAAKVYGKLGNKALSSAERSEAAKYSKRADSAQAAADARKANRKPMSDKTKRALKIGAIATGTALAAYGTYKITKVVQSKQYERGYAAYQKAATKSNNEMYSWIKEQVAATSPISQTVSDRYGSWNYSKDPEHGIEAAYRYTANNLPSAKELRKLGRRK